MRNMAGARWPAKRAAPAGGVRKNTGRVGTSSDANSIVWVNGGPLVSWPAAA